MVIAGLDPFREDNRRLSALPMEEFTNGLVAFKRSLYDGLRCRLLSYSTHHPDGAGYYSKQAMRIRVPSLLTDAMSNRLRALGILSTEVKPRWVISDQFRLAPVRATEAEKQALLLYNIETGLISVLDGYVSPDLSFDDPIEVH